MDNKQYVLITPARNEEKYIEKTMESVVNQTILPKKWIIVSDGSIDRTDEIVKIYESKYDFIQLLRVTGQKNRNFASKVIAIKAGYVQLKDFKYEFIGNLDADVSLPQDYYEKIITKIEQKPKLGIAGGVVSDFIKGKFVKQNTSLNSVAGTVQFFRRRCYEDIGGYIPLKHGGVDAAAEIMARMKGWEVQTFPKINVFQHRRVGTANVNILLAAFHRGKKFYLLGYHPLFQLIRCVSRIMDKPYLIGSIFELAGYSWSYLRGDRLQLPENVVKYLRSEQMERLWNILRRKRPK